MGIFPHAPQTRLTGVWRGFGRFGYPTPTHARKTSPRGGKRVCGAVAGCHGAGNGIAWAKKTPRMAGQEKTPRISPWGCVVRVS